MGEALDKARAKIAAMTPRECVAFLRRLDDFVDNVELDELANMSDEDVNRELAEMGVDVPAMAERIRGAIEKAIADSKEPANGE